MKKTFSRLAILLCLSFLQVSYAYSQDKPKQQTKKEANTDDMDSEGDVPPEDEAPAEKKKNFGPRIGLGLEGGVGISVLEMDVTKSHVNISGTMGAYADIRMFGKFYVQPGLFYTLNGGGNVTFDRITDYPHGVIINMVELPVIIAYKTGMPGTKVRFTIGAGGYIGYNAGAAINSIDLNIGTSSNDDIKPVEAGVALNLGLELKSGLFFRFKSQRGVTDLQPNSFGSSIYTESHVITIGYLINRYTIRHRPSKAKESEYMHRRM